MPASTLNVREGSLQDLRRMAADERLYAILDACDEPAVPPKMTELGPEKAVSLFQGDAEHRQWAVAPYLTRVDEKLLEWIVTTLWCKPWGIFAVAEADLETLRKHFRRFLIVQDPNGETMYFRYYDPRILAAFLPPCTQDELKTFFGSVKAFTTGGPEAAAVRFFLLVPG
jgi:Domain of unknown function (DUF4123)